MTSEPETPKPASTEEAQLALARAMYAAADAVKCAGDAVKAAADAVEAASRVVRDEAQKPVEGFGVTKP